MQERDYTQFRLCYVDGARAVAYFTSGDVRDMWGDDWNDAPYEHNAGEPYEPRVSRTRKGDRLPVGEWELGGMPKWQILQARFSDMKDIVTLPHDGYTRENLWSVEQVNRGEVPWFRVWEHGSDGPRVVDQLDAGATYTDFCEFVTRYGGLIWMPASGMAAAISPQSRPDIPLEEAA